MTIHQVAEKLNDRARRYPIEIASLPALRQKYLHKKQLPGHIFTTYSVKDSAVIYTFHNGDL